MKVVRESLYEKFTEAGDPVRDMNIGPEGTVYRCGNCGSLVDSNYDYLPDGEEFENAKNIIDIFGENSDQVKYVWCNDCRMEDEQNQQEAYEREERERELEQEAWEREREQEAEDREREERERW
jgi:DNA-directed RNA polymerase subunit RPC12/RpoP